MKYAGSYHDTELITVTGKTTYSEWFDVEWANELYSYVKFAEAETGDSEKVDVTLERYLPNSMSAVTVLTHTQLAAAGTEEKIARSYYDGGASDVDNTLGMRVRWKYISSGTFAADQIITMTMVLYAKRI